MGTFYFNGRHGVAKDTAAAEAMWRRAASHGYAPSYGNVGSMYMTGQGVEQDMAEAVSLFRQGADQGDPTSMFNLHMAYKLGVGVGGDVAEATKWLDKANAARADPDNPWDGEGVVSVNNAR